MSVRLDWEIDDLDAPLPEGDPLRSPQRWRGRIVFATLLIVLLGLGATYVGLKVRQKQTEIERELRAAIEVELRALETGDRGLFLDRQDSKDRRWLRAQEETYNRYQRQIIGVNPWEDRSQHVEYTGRVATARVKEDNAWALVEVARGDSTWLELWFYHWSAPDGWHHTQFDQDWLGDERAIRTQHLQLTFPAGDADIVQALAHDMEGWYNMLSSQLGTSSKQEPLEFEFAYRDPTMGITPRIQWARDSLTLVSPSPHQGHLTADGSPSPDLRRQMASALAEALISRQTGVHPNQDLGPSVNALRGAIRDWAVAQLMSQARDQTEWIVSPTPFIDDLVSRFGEQIIADLTTHLDHPQTLDHLLEASSVELPTVEQRVVFHLAAANRALHDLDYFGYQDLLDPRADRAWLMQNTNQLTRRRDIAPIDQLWPAPLALHIDSVSFSDDMAWVELETTLHDGKTVRQTQFLRKANGLWLLTSPDPDYFTGMRRRRTKNLVFDYYKVDAIWFESGIPSAMQDKLDQAAADLGVSLDDLTISVETTTDLDIWALDGSRVRLTSPSITGWAINSLDETLMPMAVPVLSVIFERMLEDGPQEDDRFLGVHVGAFLWELEKLFSEQQVLLRWLGVDTRQVPFNSINELWLAGPDDSGSGLSRILVSYQTLFGFLSEKYGSNAVPSLLAHIADANDADEWLMLSVGHPLSEVEPLWEAWLNLRLNAD
jgi:hypothetical protein